MENTNSNDYSRQEWRDGNKPLPGSKKFLDEDYSSDRIDSGFGDEFRSMSNEDRSSIGYDSLSCESRDQVCGASSELELKTGKLTLTDKSVSEDSAYCSEQTSSSVSKFSKDTTDSGKDISSSRQLCFGSYAQSNDVRFLLAPFWRFLLVQNQDGDTSLHLAIINCQGKVFDAITDVLPRKEYLDMYNYLTQTPLHLAVITRQPKMVEKLINRGASIELPDRNGQTCLHLACQRSELRLLKAIIKPRPEKPEFHEKLQEVLETRNFEGLTPLQVAVSSNSLDLVKELLALGADVNAVDGKSGHTALHIAVEQNNLPIVSCLLFDGLANPNALSFSACTPLHIAAGLGLDAVVATLIAAGVDCYIENSEGDAAFQIANGCAEDILKDVYEPMDY